MPDDAPPSPIDDAEAAFVERLVRHAGGIAPVLIGQGSNNWVYRVQRGGETLALKVCKPHRAGFAAEEYAKEAWCARVAQSRGVPTPQILGRGSFEARPYQLQVFVRGQPVTDAALAWDAMGRWAHAVHAVPVSGWGPRFASEGAFQDDWQAQIAYNIRMLGEDDPLRAMDVLDASLSAELKRRFERLAATPFVMGLCHADLGLHNVLNDDGVLTLVDWGSAAGAAAPHYEINEIARAGRATVEEMEIFRRAYGLNDAAYAALQADLPIMRVLRDIDTLRWAIDRHPSDIPEQTARAKAALRAI